jgi:hypothetical protein
VTVVIAAERVKIDRDGGNDVSEGTGLVSMPESGR